MALLCNSDINQYFIDTTYKCLPNDLEDAKSFLVLIGYNNKKDLFQLILVAVLCGEDSDIYCSFYNFLMKTYKWKPNYLNFYFGAANSKAVKEIFKEKNNITIITCLFHLLQCWWRKAGAIGLRKRKYINNTKVMLFNMKLLPFMKIEEILIN